AIVSREQLIADVNRATGDVNPHESEVPLQSASEPAADGQGLGPVQQVLLRNLGAETGEGSKDLQAAAHQDNECDGIHPMTEAHDERMLASGGGDLAGLCGFDFERYGRHSASGAKAPFHELLPGPKRAALPHSVTNRRNLSSLGLP